MITPCKNEGENLPNLITSITKQIVKPILWTIIDDGSTDNTPKVTLDAAKENEWIHILRLEQTEKRDLGPHLASIMKKGFDHSILYCKNQGIEYKYLGNIDGDLTVQEDFFEKLIREFEFDPMLGIASGGIKVTKSNGVVHIKGLPEDEPSGGDMLIRKECFESCGGIPISHAYDSVLKAKARIKGWKTKRFEDTVAIEARDVCNAEGYWKGYFQHGKSNYYLNFNPFHIFAKGLIYCSHKPYYIGIAYIAGYFMSFIRGLEQIPDSEIRNYFWNKWKISYNRYLLRGIR